MKAIPWTDEEYEYLRLLAADRRLTAQDVRHALNVAFGNARTRNAVLGASHRIGVAIGHGNRGVEVSAKKRKGKGEGRLRDRLRERQRSQRRREKQMPQILSPEDPLGRIQSFYRPFAPSGPPYGVRDLTMQVCRWIDGDPRAERPFACGEVRVDGKPYCAGHCRRAWGPSYKGRMAV